MPLTITTLIEDHPDENKSLEGEHGLSFLIEKDGRTILFDTGETGAFINNAYKLKKDLSKVEDVVISHGHSDHSGGIPALIAETRSFKLHLGTGFFSKKFGVSKDKVKYVGNKFDEGFLKEKEVVYSFVDKEVTEICPGIYILAFYPRVYEDEGITPRFQLPDGNGWKQDMFTDEIMVAIETDRGMVAILGCSHPGMRNMLDAVRSRFSKPVTAVFGGTHLISVEGESLKRSLEYLKEGEFGLIGVSHCTGIKAIKELEKLEGRFLRNHTGSSFSF